MSGLEIIYVCIRRLTWFWFRIDLTEFPYPIIADENRELAVKLNMLDKDEISKDGLPLTCRAVFIVDDKKKFRLSLLYPATTGRNFE